MVKLIVKGIRANKTGVYDQILSEQAKELVFQSVVDPVWYPFELFKEVLDALCQVDAKNDPKVIMQWGRQRGQELVTAIYKHSLSDANIKTALDAYTRFHKSVFNFGEVEGTIVSDHEIQLSYNHFDAEWSNFFYLATGWQQEFFQLCIGKTVAYRFLKKPTKGAGGTQISLTWA
jgi:hypothetical protein